MIAEIKLGRSTIVRAQLQIRGERIDAAAAHARRRAWLDELIECQAVLLDGAAVGETVTLSVTREPNE